MPKVPKWLGDTVEAVFSSLLHPVEITETVDIADNLKKIQFKGDFKNIKYTPGNVIEFRINETDYRRYTPSFFEVDKGRCEVVFYLNNKGPGSDWIRQLRVGSRLKLRGPGGRLRYNAQKKYHFIFGDETSLGLVAGLKEAINAREQNYLCLLELEEAHFGWIEELGLVADKAIKTPATPAVKAIEQLDGIEASCWIEAEFYLTGNARSIQAFRKALLGHGIKSRQIRTEPYWVEGKQGL